MEKDRIVEEESVWDKKKIIIGFVSAVILLGAGIYFLKPYFASQLHTNSQTSQKSANAQHVKGLSISSFSVPSVSDVQGKIETIQEQITHLDARQIASSSPQVQKIIQDMQSLQQYPRNQAKEMCQQICSKF